MKTNNKGFSLVELIVVIAIMAILAAVAIPTFAGFITKANEASDESFLNDVKYAATVTYVVDGSVSGVEVTAEKGGTATVIEYTAAGINYKITKGATGFTCVSVAGSTETALTGEALEKAEMVAASIDWAYKFKTADVRTAPAN